jgi:hypothetical protein
MHYAGVASLRPMIPHNQHDTEQPSRICRLTEENDAEYHRANGADSDPNSVGGADRSDFMATPSSHKLTAMAAMVPRVGHKRVKPSVYLSPDSPADFAQTCDEESDPSHVCSFLRLWNFFDVKLKSSRRRDDARMVKAQSLRFGL